MKVLARAKMPKTSQRDFLVAHRYTICDGMCALRGVLQTAVVYTRDKAVMRKLDALVIAFPEVYKLVGETDIDKTYSMPKSCVSYRKPRKLNDKYRELKRVQMKQYKN